MNETDLDIVLAIADGRLAGQPKQDALERIAANPELGEALQAQLAALDALETITPASMTAPERATLHSNLIEQLNLQPAVPVPVPKQQRRPWWQPVLGLASAAALVVAIVVVPGLFSGSDDSGADIVAVAPESASLDESGGGSSGAESALGDGSDVTIPEVAQEDVIEFFADAGDEAPEPAPDDILEDATDTVGDAAEEFTISTPMANLPQVTIVQAELATCLTTLGDKLPQGPLVPVAATMTNDELVVHLGIETADGVEYAVSIVLASCTITTPGP